MTQYKGEIRTLPPDKSIAHRAALIASLAEGTTEIMNFSTGFDNQSTLDVLRSSGISVVQESIAEPGGNVKRNVVIESRGLWSLKKSAQNLMCNNSGSTMRMFSGILAAQPFESTLVGDSSLMKRPMLRIADPLRQMGATIELSPENTAPVLIRGTKDLRPLTYELPVPSAQVKSLVAFAALHAEGETRIIESLPSRNHTELMLGLDVQELPDSKRSIVVPGRRPIIARPFLVPGDPSSACFIIALGLMNRGSEIMLRDVCLNPTRTGYLDLLQKAGAVIRIENARETGGETIGDILAAYSPSMKSLSISDPATVANVIDEIPMLAVLSACMTEGFSLHNAAELRAKESDRISAVVSNLERLGFSCEEYADGFSVSGKGMAPKGRVPVESFHDHRIAMSFAIADKALAAEIDISDAAIIGVSFPNFLEIIESLET